jgi:hypothetical protein
VLEIAREGISGLWQIPSLGFSKDLAKRLNPRKSFLSRKGRDNQRLAFGNSRASALPKTTARVPFIVKSPTVERQRDESALFSRLAL